MVLSNWQGGGWGTLRLRSALRVVASAEPPLSERSEEQNLFFPCVFEGKARRLGGVSFRKARDAKLLDSAEM